MIGRPAAGAGLTGLVARVRASGGTGRRRAAVGLVALFLGAAGLGLVNGAEPGPSTNGWERPVASATAGSADGAGPVDADTELGGSPATGLGWILDMTAKAVLVLALLFLTLRLMNRASAVGGPGAANLVVLESRPLAQRASLHLVAIGDRRLVVGLSPGGLVALAELSAEELPEAELDVSPGRPASIADLPGGATFGRFARVAAGLARRGSGTR